MDETTKTPEQETLNGQADGTVNDDGFIASGGKIEEVDEAMCRHQLTGLVRHQGC